MKCRHKMFSYRYVRGQTGYDAAEGMAQAGNYDLIPRLLDWAEANLWKPVSVRKGDMETRCYKFYREKTANRIGALRPGLWDTAWQIFDQIDWEELYKGCEPVTFHGDFNLGNIIVGMTGKFTAIDWREDFGGQGAWGDKRYDLAKLYAGLIINWDAARRGEFGLWEHRTKHLMALHKWAGGLLSEDIRLIGALSLLNCAPLHKPPLDKILVEIATELMEYL